MNPYRIFLSSPGDCREEREAVHTVVARLNADPLVSSFTRLEVVAWDWGAGVPLEALSSPQVSVDRHLAYPEDCDLFLGIFSCRFGTPLPAREFRKLDGTPYLSGSEYEFHRAWEARRRGAVKPATLMYRRQVLESSCVDHEQFEKLEAFFRQPPFMEQEQWVGSVACYHDLDEFVAQLEGHLRRLLSKRQPGAPPSFEVWLHNQAALLTTNAGPRYSQNAHVETDIGKVFDWLLCREAAIAAFDHSLAEAWRHTDNDDSFAALRNEMASFAAALRNNTHWENLPDFTSLGKTLERIKEHAWAELDEHWRNGTSDRSQETLRSREYWLRQAAYKAEEAITLLQTYSPLTQKRVLLLIGPAGQGKTHTLIHEINRALEAGEIALGVLGHSLNAPGGLWPVICQRVAWEGNSDQLLDKLEHMAANRKQRALVVIDALNETSDRRRWRNELLGMIREVLRRPHLTLAISVRSDYMQQTLPVLPDGTESPWVVRNHPGFSEIEPEAMRCYFEHYDVKAPVAPPLGEFGNPLYVQLLAKSMRGRELRHWLPSWLEVWRTWMDWLEEEARDKLGLDDASRPDAIRRTMHRLAQAMLEENRFWLPRRQADEIAKGLTDVDHAIAFLCSAGALMDRLDEEEQDIIEFGFERLSDTFLANRMLATLFAGLDDQQRKQETLRAALAPGGALRLFVERNLENAFLYRRAGLLNALCLAVPLETEMEFPSLLPENDTNGTDSELNRAFTDSLRWRCRPEEFGADRETLRTMWRKCCGQYRDIEELDELIRFALIPDHPFAMEHIIHPRMLQQETPGARDAIWSVHLVPLWFDEHSTLRQLVIWARDAPLRGIHDDIALAVARLLAWFCATSQNELRQAAIKGLTRVLVACPRIMGEFLPEFLEVNDPYILEAVLVAVWGGIQDGSNPDSASLAARLVYNSQFPQGSARWCHITLRHYARRIVEDACRQGRLRDIDPSTVSPPYQSTLPLNAVPAKEELKSLDGSEGYGSIVFSCCDWDFYRYVMGGNSASLDFSAIPLSASTEPARPFLRSEHRLSPQNEDIFDLALAARFVAWNCLKLGWTTERFEDFDSGHYTQEHGRFGENGRTERIGKKYQWIGWHTLLGFLADNYAMRPDWTGQQQLYDTPSQVDVDLHDPARWLQQIAPVRAQSDKQKFWRVPGLPAWPRHDLQEMQSWVASSTNDLPPSDLIAWVPDLPKVWGEGPWLRLAAEHIWQSRFAPGQWGLGKKYYANLWWQCWPFLIRIEDLSSLVEQLEIPQNQRHLTSIGRLDPVKDWHSPLTQWFARTIEGDTGLHISRPNRHDFWLPVGWRPFIGECGHPDRRDEHAPVLLPLPSLFQEWGLTIDLRYGLVLRDGTPIYGIAGWILGEHALFAHLHHLQTLLAVSGYALVWWWRGERRAFMHIGSTIRMKDESAWADYHGIGYLGSDGRVQTAWLQKMLQ